MAPAGVEAWSETSRVLEDVIDKLQAFGGRVEELTPTGVVAVFGVDLVDDPSRRAAHAATPVTSSAPAAARSQGSVPCGARRGESTRSPSPTTANPAQ